MFGNESDSTQLGQPAASKILHHSGLLADEPKPHPQITAVCVQKKEQRGMDRTLDAWPPNPENDWVQNGIISGDLWGTMATRIM